MDDFMSTSAPETNDAADTAEAAATASAAPAPKSGKPKSFSCPSCGGIVTIKALGISISAVCRQCSSTIDVANENYRIIEKVSKKTQPTFLEMGMRGRFEGIEWEVIGYMEKTDGSGIYTWDEYLLFNPYHGFRFLVQAEGHWNLVKVLRQSVSGAGIANETWLGDTRFAVYLKGEAVVSYVKGEFYWRARRGERTMVADYIAPPAMLSVEKNSQEINVSLGHYIEARAVAEAFNLKKDMPLQLNVAPNQPAPYQGKMHILWLVACMALLAAFVLQLMADAASDDELVYTAQATVMPEQKGQTFSTPAFNLKKEGNVMIQTNAPVQNDWVELGITLVNEQATEEYEMLEAIEYYYGHDSDGNWSEGKQYARDSISKVPSGDYRLLIEVDAGAFQRGSQSTFNVMVKRDVPDWSNFWFTLVMLLAYPLFAALRRWSFECKRWANSDYAPAIYRQGEGDDD